ncbi:FHA domain-containing protein [Streptomyces sp. DG2A-72]|uniref:FHA domain-containing protein n=1 Tax=Streptomyces sp. DG2A-72 TaxID=3051386 RepID=UPI00265C1C31|nr:FHA domain-containing protein [Streptomyces sp. DG2A-72]MDO0933603.1 FHA domain-containing protein [Streptomyces sp. DG2A-72]
MQIRLTVVDPLGAPAPGRAASCDVLVTAPAGTALSAVASALASAVSGSDGPAVLFAGAERLDDRRCTLGEPPLIDGAVLSLGAPAEPEPHPEVDDAPTRLDIVAGPDAGGVHLLHGGQIHIGRSADADVALDDPDVSRLHCAVTVATDGRVTVADLGSTNGTTLDGAPVTTRPVRFTPGALLRIGESALRLAPAGGPGPRLPTAPDGEGHVRVPAEDAEDPRAPHARAADTAGTGGPSGRTSHAHGTGAWTAQAQSPGEAAVVPEQGGAPRIERRGTASDADTAGGSASRRRAGGGDTHGGRFGVGGPSVTSGGASADGGGFGAAGGGGRDGGAHGAAAGSSGRDTDAYGAQVGGGRNSGSFRTAAGGGPADAVPGTTAHGSQPGRGSGARAMGGLGDMDSGAGAGGILGGTAPGVAGGDTFGGSHSGAAGRSPGSPDLGTTTGGTHSDAGSGATAGRSLDNPDPRTTTGGTHSDAGSSTTAGRSLGDTAPRTAGGRSPGGPDARTGADGVGRGGAGVGGAVHDRLADGTSDAEASDHPAEGRSRRKGTPLRGTDVPQGVRRRGGLTAWARRLAGGRAEQGATAGRGAYDADVADVVAEPLVPVPQLPETWPDPAALLLTALGPGPRLWERGPGHPEALTVRLGTADRAAPDGSGLLPAVPVTADLREVGALGLAGPRARLAGLARAVVAQLTALHSPSTLEVVLISADRSRPLPERTAEWSWLGWLPHLRPGHGQDCRLLLAYDREQATARMDELLRRMEDHLAELRSGPGATGHGLASARTAGGPTPPTAEATATAATPGTSASGTSATAAGPTLTASVSPAPSPAAADTAAPLPSTGHTTASYDTPADHPDHAPDPTPQEPVRGAVHRPSWAAADDEAVRDKAGFPGPYTVVVVDGDPGGADVREAVTRLASEGPRVGIHVVCLAETAPASPASPVTETYEAACAASPAFRECGAVALLSGDVATALRLLRVAGAGATRPGPVGHGTVAAVDAVSLAWAERFARALAPLRTEGAGGERQGRVSAPLPQAARLLDELGLARATPASLMARWADAADDAEALGGRALAVLGAGPRGPVCADLVAEGPHLLIEGPHGSGRTELLRAVVASLAAAERPDRLSVVLIDGRDSVSAGTGHGEGLRVCTDVPHVTTHLAANDPVRMREFAQSLSAELKRRAELLGRADFAEWHTGRQVSGRMVAQRSAGAGAGVGVSGAGDLDAPPSSTLRLRPAAARQRAEAISPLPRLVVVVDDLDALVSPALGSPGRPAAGSVMRALEAVAREGERLGVHLVAAAGVGGRTAQTEPAQQATLRVALDPPAPGPDEPAPGRGRLTCDDGRVTPFQGGRVTGRIPRTATLRPTVIPLEWERMGDPPTRRPVRELGNGPTDLALLASALERAAREVSAVAVPSLL